MPSLNHSLPVAVHRCRFVKHIGSTIVSIAAAEKIVAVARANGNIELWNAKAKGWFLERTIPGSAQIEAVCITDNRLFAAGLSGNVWEYDLEALKPIHSTDSHGGAVWSMAVNNDGTSLAIGCEDGHVRIFAITADGLEFAKTSEQHGGRIMALAWHPSGKFVVSGSIKGEIRILDTQSGVAAQRMTLDTYRGEDTIVWDLLVLPDSTIVSGDSLGNVSLFDWHSATLAKRFKAHSADVLCLAANRSGNRIFSSGVDRKVVELTLTTTSSSGSDALWVISGQRKFHTHDVRAIAYLQDRPFDALVTGGVDTSLVISSPASKFMRMTQQRMPTFPHRSIVSLATPARLVMAHMDDHVNVWSLGNAVNPLDSQPTIEDHQPLEHRPHQLLLTIKPKLAANISASAISNNGSLIAVSDCHRTKLFRVTYATNDDAASPQIAPMKASGAVQLPGSHSIKFTPDGTRMVVAGNDSVVYIVGIDASMSYSVIHAFDDHKAFKRPSTIVSTVVSFDGQWLVTGDVSNNIFVYNLDALMLHAKMPMFKSIHTFIGFHQKKHEIVVTCGSNEFYIYDVDNGRLNEWSRKYSHQLPARFLDNRDTIMGAFFHPVSPHSLMLWGAGFMCTIDTSATLVSNDVLLNSAEKRSRETEAIIDSSSKKHSSESGAHRVVDNEQPMQFREPIIKTIESSKKNSSKPDAFNMDHRFQSVMFAGTIGSEIVVVERPVLQALACLPNAFFKHKYGS